MTVDGMTLEEFIAHTQASTYSHEPLTLLVAVACKQQELADLGEQLLDHFVEEARVVLAQDEVRRLHHDQLGTAHLMLGLLAEGTGTAAQVLAGVGITLDSARAAVEEITGCGRESPGGRIRLAAPAKKALELALGEARALGHHHLGTEHLLLGLLKEGEDTGAKVIVTAGVHPDQLREAVLAIVEVEEAQQ
jgi:ATP-dependent Clp protease ATP-binding subunit ClpC